MNYSWQTVAGKRRLHDLVHLGNVVSSKWRYLCCRTSCRLHCESTHCKSPGGDLQCSKLPRNVNHWSLLSRSLLRNRCETEHTAENVENTGEGGKICSPFLIYKVRWRRKEAAFRCDTCLGTQVSARLAGQRLVRESV